MEEDPYELSRTMCQKAKAGDIRGASVVELGERAKNGDGEAWRALENRARHGENQAEARKMLESLDQ